MYTPVNPSFTIQKWGLRGGQYYIGMFSWWDPGQTAHARVFLACFKLIDYFCSCQYRTNLPISLYRCAVLYTLSHFWYVLHRFYVIWFSLICWKLWEIAAYSICRQRRHKLACALASSGQGLSCSCAIFTSTHRHCKGRYGMEDCKGPD